jgi:hypothetical protein
MQFVYLTSSHEDAQFSSVLRGPRERQDCHCGDAGHHCQQRHRPMVPCIRHVFAWWYSTAEGYCFILGGTGVRLGISHRYIVDNITITEISAIDGAIDV